MVASSLTAPAEGDPDEWLETACRCLCDLNDGPVAAHAVLLELSAGPGGWTVRNAASAGMPDGRAMRALTAHARTGWPEEDRAPVHLLDDAPQRLVPVCGARAAFISDAHWATSPVRTLRERYGLFDFARAIVPAPLAHGAQVLALELSGLDEGWRVSPALVDALSAAAPHVHDGFYRAFLAREDLREHLLGLVTPTQRFIAPLIAEGLSETEIGARVGRSKHTIHDHIKNIYRAWGVRTRGELREVWEGRLAPHVPPPPVERKPVRGAREPASDAIASLRRENNGALEAALSDRRNHGVS